MLTIELLREAKEALMAPTPSYPRGQWMVGTADGKRRATKAELGALGLEEVIQMVKKKPKGGYK